MTTSEVAPSDTEEPDGTPGERVAGAFAFAAVKPLVGLVVPLTAVAAALGVGAVMLLALGANPLQGYGRVEARPVRCQHHRSAHVRRHGGHRVGIHRLRIRGAVAIGQPRRIANRAARNGFRAVGSVATCLR